MKAWIWVLPAMFVATLSLSLSLSPDAAAKAKKFKLDVATSDKDKPAVTQKALQKQRHALSRALRQVQAGSRARDVVGLNCVNEKLTAIKGLLRASEQADVAMAEALARSDSVAANHAFQKVVLASQKSIELGGQSEGCLGAITEHQGDMSLEVEIQAPDGSSMSPSAQKEADFTSMRPENTQSILDPNVFGSFGRPQAKSSAAAAIEDTSGGGLEAAGLLDELEEASPFL